MKLRYWFALLVVMALAWLSVLFAPACGVTTGIQAEVSPAKSETVLATTQRPVIAPATTQAVATSQNAGGDIEDSGNVSAVTQIEDSGNTTNTSRSGVSGAELALILVGLAMVVGGVAVAALYLRLQAAIKTHGYTNVNWAAKQEWFKQQP